jgi:hypothetical protein
MLKFVKNKDIIKVINIQIKYMLQVIIFNERTGNIVNP